MPSSIQIAIRAITLKQGHLMLGGGQPELELLTLRPSEEIGMEHVLGILDLNSPILVNLVVNLHVEEASVGWRHIASHIGSGRIDQ